MLIKLIRELVFLTTMLIIAISALLINLSLKSDDGGSTVNKEVVIDKPAPIINQAGKKLFKENCASCHNRNMVDRMTGPALGGSVDRWKNNDVTIQEFIRNAPAVLAGSNPYAKELLQEFSVEMTPFTKLSDEDIESLLGYIEEMYQRNR